MNTSARYFESPVFNKSPNYSRTLSPGYINSNSIRTNISPLYNHSFNQSIMSTSLYSNSNNMSQSPLYNPSNSMMNSRKDNIHVYEKVEEDHDEDNEF